MIGACKWMITSKNDCAYFSQSRRYIKLNANENKASNKKITSTLIKVCWSGKKNYSRVRPDRRADRQAELQRESMDQSGEELSTNETTNPINLGSVC